MYTSHLGPSGQDFDPRTSLIKSFALKKTTENHVSLLETAINPICFI